MSVQKLVEISNSFGRDENMVIAGGGNTSFKDENFLYIKGSGTGLRDIKGDGFVKMNRAKLDTILKTPYPDEEKSREAQVLADLLAAREPGEEHKRPSVETLLHNILTYSYVVHLHPAFVNGLTCSARGRISAAEIFGNDFIWIENIEPGYVLSKRVYDEYKLYTQKHSKDARIIFLQNHGVFAAADTVEEIYNIYNEIGAKLKAKLVEEPDFSDIAFNMEKAVQTAPALRMLTMGEGGVAAFFTNKEVGGFLADKNAFSPVSSAFTPDHIVYCGLPLFLEENADIGEEIEKYREVHSRVPKVIAVQNLGIFACAPSKNEAKTIQTMFLDTVKIAVYTKSFGGHSFMPQSLIDFIVGWEAESYRKSVGNASGNLRLSGKIAVVTGSAQGFGEGIAKTLAENGAHVVVADLNGELAKKTAQEICLKSGNKKAVAVQTDVTDEDSVSAMVCKTVLEFGGIDVFINNAGIVRAGGLDEMEKADFEMVTNVNYTAYFLCVKHASRVMKIQNKYRAGYFTDIIQINSKSGLAGSLKNFAYAGSKFGGIGLTQSFALELAEFCIKVNTVCPGNFYDGPLWADPEKGLFVQYLHAGKVAGAKTTDDVRKFYEEKAPIKRGCTVEDVAKAIFYCIEQKYETGQAIPVTGGQIMLS